jgi:hypothetical protein
MAKAAKRPKRKHHRLTQRACRRCAPFEHLAALRRCAGCGLPYRGPARYCSFACAVVAP